MVTADDLGYAPERDAGILHGFEHGCISQASVNEHTEQARIEPSLKQAHRG